MATRPRLRKLALTAHIVCSVGWLGAVAVFLALAISAVTSQDPEVVRGVHLAMRSIGWLVLVPLSVASLLTGLLQSLSSKWGLLRHYWVLVKLALNILATAILLLYMQTLDTLGDIAAQSSGDDLSGLRDPSPVLHAGGALLLLVGAAAVSVYKPRGLTPYGQARTTAAAAAANIGRTPPR